MQCGKLPSPKLHENKQYALKDLMPCPFYYGLLFHTFKRDHLTQLFKKSFVLFLKHF